MRKDKIRTRPNRLRSLEIQSEHQKKKRTSPKFWATGYFGNKEIRYLEFKVNEIVDEIQTAVFFL
jgi:hypothetical protein